MSIVGTLTRKAAQILCVAGFAAAGVVIAPLPASASTIVCGGTPVPAGYVITANLYSSSCGSGTINAVQIELPYVGVLVCGNSPRPAGWVVVGFGYSSACTGISSNSRVLQHV